MTRKICRLRRFIPQIIVLSSTVGLIAIAVAQRDDAARPEISETILKHAEFVPRNVQIPDGSPQGKLEELGFRHPKLYHATKDPSEARALEARRKESRIAFEDPNRFVEAQREERRKRMESSRNVGLRQQLLKTEEDLLALEREAVDSITKPEGRKEKARGRGNGASIEQEAFAFRAILRPHEVAREIEPLKKKEIRDRETDALNALSVAREFWNEERHLRNHGFRRPAKIESHDTRAPNQNKDGRP